MLSSSPIEGLLGASRAPPHAGDPQHGLDATDVLEILFGHAQMLIWIFVIASFLFGNGVIPEFSYRLSAALVAIEKYPRGASAESLRAIAPKSGRNRK